MSRHPFEVMGDLDKSSHTLAVYPPSSLVCWKQRAAAGEAKDSIVITGPFSTPVRQRQTLWHVVCSNVPVAACDLDKAKPRGVLCSAGNKETFIYSPFDTPVTASGGVIFSR